MTAARDPIDWSSPVDWSHPLNKGSELWLLDIGQPGRRGGAKWRDLTRNREATFAGGAQTWQTINKHPGGVGYTLLDGADDLIATPMTNLAYPGGTVSWWMYGGTDYNSSTIRSIWGQILAFNTNPSFSAQLFSDNNWYIGWNGAGGDHRISMAATAGNWCFTTWAYYSFTWSTTGASVLYRNGVEIGRNATSPTVYNVGQPFDIGRFNTVYGLSLATDDFRIYSRELNAGEIRALYDQSRLGNPDLLRRTSPRRGQAQPSGGNTYSATIAETGSAADTISAQAAFNSALAESLSAAETVSAAATYARSLAESTTAVETVSSAGVFGVSVSESVSVTDLTSAAATFARTVSESVTALDTVGAAASFTASIAESASASDVVAAAAVFAATLAEGVNATDVLSAAAVFSSSLTETATASDLVTSAAIMVASIAEHMSAADIYSYLDGDTPDWFRIALHGVLKTREPITGVVNQTTSLHGEIG